ncbi:MAG: hypothetical protein ACWA5R_11365 [bacterium]
MTRLIERFEWKELRSADSSTKLPEAIKILASSDNEDQLDDAYWSIDNESVLQGTLYQSALAVVCCLLEILSSCKGIARPYILELLVQLISGAPAKSEIDKGNSELVNNVRSEVLKFIPQFFQILEYESEPEKAHCIDILGICALEDSTLKQKVREKFNSLNGSFENDGINKLIENWLIELL